jgi:hypothetical protein
VLTSWPPYCLLAAALIAMWLMQNSFSAAPLHASLPGMTAAEPVSGILLGVVVFGDVIRISPGMLAIQAAGIVALVIGVIMVARAPVLGQIRPVPAKLSHGGPENGPDQADQAGPATPLRPAALPPVTVPVLPIPPPPAPVLAAPSAPVPAAPVPPGSAGLNPSAALRPAAGGARSVPAPGT